MMTYDTFKNELTKKLAAQMGKAYTVLITPGITEESPLDVLHLIHNASGFSHSCRISILYNYHDSGQENSLDFLTHTLIKTFLTLKQKTLPLETDRIIYRLVNRKVCKEHNEMPHIPFYDMEILFYSSMELANGLHCNLLIDHALMAQNHLSINKLTTLAYQNTFRLFPSKIQEIGEYYLNELTHDSSTKPEELVTALLMKKLVDQKNLKDSEKRYVLTSNVTHDGGTALLNMAVLKEFSDTLGYDLLILPGTNCGFVIQPWTEDTNLADVKKVVSEILESDDSDILTNQIFCYNRTQEKLELLE